MREGRWPLACWPHKAPCFPELLSINGPSLVLSATTPPKPLIGVHRKPLTLVPVSPAG